MIVYLHKDEILVAINKEFNKKINGELSVKEVDFNLLENFPDFSFTLVQPLVKDSLYPIHRKPLFKAEKVYLKFSLLKLLRQQVHLQSVTLQNADIFLFKGKNNYANFHIFKQSSIAIPFLHQNQLWNLH
jgi:hypothetical protein